MSNDQVAKIAHDSPLMTTSEVRGTSSYAHAVRGPMTTMSPWAHATPGTRVLIDEFGNSLFGHIMQNAKPGPKKTTFNGPKSLTPTDFLIWLYILNIPFPN